MQFSTEKKNPLFRVAKVNSFGVIESKTSAFPRGKATKLYEENNLLAVAQGSSDRYILIEVCICQDCKREIPVEFFSDGFCQKCTYNVVNGAEEF